MRVGEPGRDAARPGRHVHRGRHELDVPPRRLQHLDRVAVHHREQVAPGRRARLEHAAVPADQGVTVRANAGVEPGHARDQVGVQAMADLMRVPGDDRARPAATGPSSGRRGAGRTPATVPSDFST